MALGLVGTGAAAYKRRMTRFAAIIIRITTPAL